MRAGRPDAEGLIRHVLVPARAWWHTIGVIPAIAAWVFSRGSYRGSFEGELREFARLAERAAEEHPSGR